MVNNIEIQQKENQVALSIRNATKTFGKNVAVNDLSFDLLSGEVFGFLGPNGAGKSTMIKMIMGFLSMDEGTVIINGFDREREYEKAMACLGGIVENPEMYKDLTGRTNLVMYARLHDNVVPERIDEALRLVGMQDRANEKVRKYSLGMKQRVGLAQAILHRPRVLLLDEPTNGLAPAGIRELRDILKKLAHEEDVAVMVSSHILSEMQMMCDRVAIINKGKLLDIKLVEELKALSMNAGTHRIGVTSVDKALAALLPEDRALVSAQTENSIDIRVDKKKVASVVRRIVESGVDIDSVISMEGSLEDAYMQITGGGMKIE